MSNLIRKNIKIIKNFNLNYFDDDSCNDYIEKNFSKKIFQAYNLIKPQAYKADFWRYCILYLNGGIYSDLLQKFFINFENILNLEQDIILTRDQKNSGVSGYKYLLWHSKKSLFLEFIINALVNKIHSKNYGKNQDFSGPHFFLKASFFFKKSLSELIDISGKHIFEGIDKKKYKIDIAFYEKNGYIYCYDDNRIVIKRKEIPSDLIYNFSRSQHYTKIWPNIFY